MRLRKIFLVPAILFISFQTYSGQEQLNSRLIDEFGKLCSEELMARYDSFLGQLQNDPSAEGHIVFYGNRSTEGKNLKFVGYLKEFYPTVRGFDKTRILLTRGENQNEMKTQFWLVPAGAIPPKPEAIFTEEKIASTKQYDKSWADFNKWSGSLDIYSDGFLDLGCEFSPNTGGFAKTLLANRELKGYLIVYTEFGKGVGRGNRIASFAVKNLIKNHQVPRNRLKTIYGGNRQEPEIEFWFVPKNDQPPSLTPDKKRK